METNKGIQKEIERTFDVLNTKNEVHVSPFFKDKTLRRLFLKKEEKEIVWLWFTPKLQLATLAVVIVLNIIALSQLESNSMSENSIDDFATTYELSYDDESTFFD